MIRDADVVDATGGRPITPHSMHNVLINMGAYANSRGDGAAGTYNAMLVE